MQEKRFRSVVKTISWRTLATLDTFIISYIITGNIAFAGGIASLEVATKVLFYYLHERAWVKIKWGIDK